MFKKLFARKKKELTVQEKFQIFLKWDQRVNGWLQEEFSVFFNKGPMQAWDIVPVETRLRPPLRVGRVTTQVFRFPL
jgi:hypothetical protein